MISIVSSKLDERTYLAPINGKEALAIDFNGP